MVLNMDPPEQVRLRTLVTTSTFLPPLPAVAAGLGVLRVLVGLSPLLVAWGQTARSETLSHHSRRF